jgi:ferredoxin
MANVILDTCINCGACEAECPNEAITVGEDVYVIDPDLCDECAAEGGVPACREACPEPACIVAA